MAKLKTLEGFIQDSRNKHGDRYDYSLVEYVNSQTKVKIICANHGVFNQSPNKHLLGRGCPKCVGKGKNTKDFILQAQKAHSNRYDYSLSEYIGSTKKLKIICAKHGEFEQIASLHLSGAGCQQCANDVIRSKRLKSQSQFIQDAQKIHGNQYDYSLAEYVDSRTKVKIICAKHGEFTQTPTSHLNGSGCNKCGRIKTIGARKGTIESFIQKANHVHQGAFDYSITEYIGNSTKVKIICPKHGVFQQSPGNHLSGKGCPSCGVIVRSDKQRSTTNEFVEKAKAVHGDKYDYSSTEYIKSSSVISVCCPLHGVFRLTAKNHLKGRGCASCADWSFDKSKKATLYLLKFQKDFVSFWKVGITNRTVKDRFLGDRHFIVFQREWQFDKGIHAYQIEQEVLKQFQTYKQPPMLFPLLTYGGDTECFTPNLPHKKVIEVINKLASACV